VIEKPDSSYPLTIKPYRLPVSRAGEIDIDEITFEITNVSDETLNLTLVDQPPGYFIVDLPENIGPGETAEAALKVRPERLDQAFEKSITLEVNDNARSRFTVPVFRRFIGAGRQPKTQQTTTTGTGGGNK